MGCMIDTVRNGIHLRLQALDEAGGGRLALTAFAARRPETLANPMGKAELQGFSQVHLTGENQAAHHGGQHQGSNAGGILRYVSHAWGANAAGETLTVVEVSAACRITTHWQFYIGIPIVRSWREVTNVSDKAIGLEYVSAFEYAGLGQVNAALRDEGRLHLPYHSWMAEMQWKTRTLSDCGLSSLPVHVPIGRFSVGNTGSWGTKEMLPMAVLEDPGSGETFFWQIEHHGSWNWELGSRGGDVYLALSGPSERENQWWKSLAPGESFVTVPVAVGVIQGTSEAAFNVLTAYRRRMRRAHWDNEKLPVVFNDYMNCLMGDPTTAKLLPLIDKAAEAGCEFFVIDAGWYSDGHWWNLVGEWLPSQARFPGGIAEPLRIIREKGMVPGLWLEIERMGIQCPLAAQWPDECFFMRHGKRVIDHHSYQLDFRHPTVVAHADGVVARLVNDYGVGFIKMDYNIEIGAGTEVGAGSVGDGLLEHQRAYLAWLKRLFVRYPDLIIENCSSGAMRLAYSLMEQHTVCSTTDNQDYLGNARISINTATGVTPEQAGVWAYPLTDADEESVIMNMVSAMSWRIYLSGRITDMNPNFMALIQAGIDGYKEMRALIPRATLHWPLGLVQHNDPWGAFAFTAEGTTYLSVWRFGAQASVEIPCPWIADGKKVEVSCFYPASHPVPFTWDRERKVLTVEMVKANSARILRFSKNDGCL